MVKNKNKRFDLARRQEKILKRMAKPLYKKSDNSKYFVITQPFGMHPSPAQRGAVDVNRLSSWISWVFRRESVVEAVYTMSTRDEVVVRIAHGVNPDLMLGKHKYSDILNAGWLWHPSPASCAFVYDYQNHGDPSNHNWREHIASDDDAPPPPGHFRRPYPIPTWTLKPSHLAGLALPLPDSLPRSPEPSPEPLALAPSEAPPSHTQKEVKQGPSHSHNPDNAAAKDPSSAPGRVKVDPFGDVDSSIASGEPAAYEPAQELRDQIALLNASRPQASVRVKQEPVTQVKHEPSNSDPTPFRSETYNAPNPEVGRSGGSEDQSLTSVAEPSQALWDEYFRYQSNQRKRSDPAPPVKQEPSTSQPMAPPHPTQSRGTVESIDFVPREHFPSFKRIKPERGSDEDVQPWKRPKSEIT